jgi:hypothetical protein
MHKYLHYNGHDAPESDNTTRSRRRRINGAVVRCVALAWNTLEAMVHPGDLPRVRRRSRSGRRWRSRNCSDAARPRYTSCTWAGGRPYTTTRWSSVIFAACNLPPTTRKEQAGSQVSALDRHLNKFRTSKIVDPERTATWHVRARHGRRRSAHAVERIHIRVQVDCIQVCRRRRSTPNVIQC